MHQEKQDKFKVLSYNDTLKEFLCNILLYGIVCCVLLEIANWIPWLAVAGFTIYVLFAARSTIRSGCIVVSGTMAAFSNTPSSLKRWLASFVMSIDALIMVGCSLFLYNQLF
jgi:hypothetical protein